MSVPMGARKVAEQKSTPATSVEVDMPNYHEVPEFQRVAIIGDYASGVLLLTNIIQRTRTVLFCFFIVGKTSDDVSMLPS